MTGLALRARPYAMSGQAPVAELAQLQVFERLDGIPHRYFVHLEHDDRNAPLIRPGEVVVIDQGGAQYGGWYPTEGGLFLIEHRSRPQSACDRYPRVSRQIVQTFEGRHGWYAGSMRRGIVGNRLYCSDGPYNDFQQLADKLIGKVVGIYAPKIGEVMQ